jgi:hypothetical protein
MELIEHVKDRILTVDKVLSKDECYKLITKAELAGFKPSPLSGGGHGRTGREGARTSQFYVSDDKVLANRLWERIKKFVPSNLHSIKPVPYMNSETKGDEYTPVAVNEHIRFYKYDVGQFILKHDDYRMSRFRYDKLTDTYFKQMTFLTVLVYLNDDFDEGDTCFYTDYAQPGKKGHCRFIRDSESTEPNLRIKPKEGMVLINDHMVMHEGKAPKKYVKYILRTDIVHEKEVTKNVVGNELKKGEYSTWTKHHEPSCLHYTE